MDYIVKYQNNFYSSFLFSKNLHEIINMGVEVTPLLNSKIFQFTLDFDEWPNTHVIKTKYIRPYNGSLFNLRGQYPNIFPEKELQALKPEESDKLNKN